MKLLNGKFYDKEGNEVKPEFGNKEQIRLIEEAQRTLDELRGDGVVVDPEITTITKVSVDFKCICGQTVYFRDKEFDDDCAFPQEEMAGEKTSCRSCKRNYLLAVNDGDLVVKLTK